MVGVETTLPFPWTNDYVGNPLNLAVSPNPLTYYRDCNMTFWKRIHNVLKSHWDILSFHNELSVQDDIIKKHLSSELPPSSDLIKTTALLLTNSHYSLHEVVPKVPAHIEIGGIHIKNDTSSLDSVKY